MIAIYAIRSKDGMWYKPNGYNKFWNKEFKKAKIYTKIGHAKCAITNKLDEWNSWKSKSGFVPYKDSEERESYKKFQDAEIVIIGGIDIEYCVE